MKAYINPLQTEAYHSGAPIIVSTEKLALEEIPVRVTDVEPYNEDQALLRWARKEDGE